MKFLAFAFLTFIESKKIVDFNTSLGLATITYDEGPSEYTGFLSEKACSYGIPLTFHFKSEKITKGIANMVFNHGHIIGICYDDLPEDLEEAKKSIEQQKNEFIKKTNMVPVLARLPRSGFTKEQKEFCLELGHIVTEPNLDSEDIEMPTYFTDFLLPEIFCSNPAENSFSICLRDKFLTSVNSLEMIVNALFDKGYRIVDISTYLNVTEREIQEEKNDKDLANEVGNKPIESEEIIENVEPKNIKEEFKNDIFDENKLKEIVNNIPIKEETSDGLENDSPVKKLSFNIEENSLLNKNLDDHGLSKEVSKKKKNDSFTFKNNLLFLIVEFI